MRGRTEISLRGGRALIVAAGTTGAWVTISPTATGTPIDDRTFFGAEATLIDFETDGAGLPVMSPDADPLMNGEKMTLPAGEYAPMGVTFDQDLNWVNDGYPLFDAAATLSSMNGQGGSGVLSIPASAMTAFDIVFTTPVDAFGMFVANNISAQSVVTFHAYDAADQLIESVAFGGGFIDASLSNSLGQVDYGFMGIAATPGTPIVRVSVFKDAAILDDLVFTQIPAPGAVGALVLGAAPYLRRKRR